MYIKFMYVENCTLYYSYGSNKAKGVLEDKADSYWLKIINLSYVEQEFQMSGSYTYKLQFSKL